MRVSVVVITYQRPACVRRNLEHCARQSEMPGQVIVVDASEDEATREVVAEFPFVEYVRNPDGAGNMTSSRNVARRHVTGDLILFLDDDAYPEPGYVAAVRSFVEAHEAARLGCARTLNGVPGEESDGLGRTGKLLEDGTLLGFFALDPGSDIPIDHGIGATMWMRRSLLEELGGFRELFTRFSVREDADLFLRARALGHQAWFVRSAVATHVGAPKASGRRFDLRYQWSASRNHAVLMIVNFGVCSRIFRRALVRVVSGNLAYGGAWHRRVGRTIVCLEGFVTGLSRTLWDFGLGPLDPIGGYERGSTARSRRP